MSKATDEVMALEKGFWTEGDAQFFERNFADDGITIFEPMGFIEKAQAVQSAGDEAWREVQMKDVVVREVTPDVIVVAYHGSGRRGDKDPYHVSIGSTYVRLDGRWQLALTAHQPWKPDQESDGKTGTEEKASGE